MKSVTEQVWRTDGGEELIRCVDGRHNVIPAFCDRSKLRELGEAIADVLKRLAEEEVERG